MISDADRRISQKLGFLDPADYEHNERFDSVALPVRGSYLLDPDFVVRAFTVYPISNGRCVTETLRMLDSLQLTTACPFVGTPASWHKGKRVVLMPGVDEELATESLGFTNVTAAEISDDEEDRAGAGKEGGTISEDPTTTTLEVPKEHSTGLQQQLSKEHSTGGVEKKSSLSAPAGEKKDPAVDHNSPEIFSEPQEKQLLTKKRPLPYLIFADEPSTRIRGVHVPHQRQRSPDGSLVDRKRMEPPFAGGAGGGEDEATGDHVAVSAKSYVPWDSVVNDFKKHAWGDQP